MKKLLLSLLILSGVSTEIYAQTQNLAEAKAKAILAEVRKEYKSYNMFSSEFTFKLEGHSDKYNTTQQGTLFRKGNKYKLIMTDYEMISDGKTQWKYIRSDNEVQVYAADNSTKTITPENLFTFYNTGFKYRYTGDKKIGNQAYPIIELLPNDTKKSYFKISLEINNKSNRIVTVQIFYKNGDKYTYLIKGITSNMQAPESFFSFNAKKYPGVEVVDLR
ncbi:outer membrane lipoprotein carrier protein LolA [Janthinobacterium sp.]|uniref:LolA family protein n=1 Tax=Janthinobacterium sp. TaxID=1871054 RepID=UPI00263A10DD|nr:outer membrane lipoprotein carrier protein LolA [Janthinobacterium sp.]